MAARVHGCLAALVRSRSVADRDFGALSPRFLTVENLGAILVQSSWLIVVALGMNFVLLTAGVDLSVGAAMYLAAVVVGLGLPDAPVWRLRARRHCRSARALVRSMRRSSCGSGCRHSSSRWRPSSSAAAWDCSSPRRASCMRAPRGRRFRSRLVARPSGAALARRGRDGSSPGCC